MALTPEEKIQVQNTRNKGSIVSSGQWDVRNGLYLFKVFAGAGHPQDLFSPGFKWKWGSRGGGTTSWKGPGPLMTLNGVPALKQFEQSKPVYLYSRPCAFLGHDIYHSQAHLTVPPPTFLLPASVSASPAPAHDYNRILVSLHCVLRLSTQF